jgi:K+-transporting ATPase ATPase B chain
VIVVGALTFLPALALGPIVEQLQMLWSRTEEKYANQVHTLYDAAMLREAAWESFRKRLSPRYQVRNPVMFVVWLGSLLTTGLFIQALTGEGEAPAAFILAITLWLWFTVLFANFAEAVAEGRGKAQAAALRGLKKNLGQEAAREPHYGLRDGTRPADDLRKGNVVWSLPAKPSPPTAK